MDFLEIEKRVVASQPIKKGDVVYVLPEVFDSKRSRHSIEVAPGVHQAYTDDIDDYINHSCDPNLKLSTVGQVAFIAIKDVEVGEEVTWDYETAETELGSPFICHCGAENCRGEIRGMMYMSDLGG